MTLRSRFWRVTRRRRRRCWWHWMPNAHSSNAASSSSALRCMLPPEIACTHVAHTLQKARQLPSVRCLRPAARKQPKTRQQDSRQTGGAQKGVRTEVLPCASRQIVRPERFGLVCRRTGGREVARESVGAT